jgi:hypothetical protein
MTYTVYYKKINSLFWKSLKRVKGDGMMDEASLNKTTNNCRWFILEDETRIEIPTHDIMFKFSKDRFMMIKTQMEKESGQRM